MLMRWRPLVCSIARFSWLGAQQPAGRAAWVGCTASANNTASLSAKEFNEFLGGQRSRIVRGRGTSNPCRAARRLLGAEPREARDRANERASAHQHSRRDRSGDRPNPDDRGAWRSPKDRDLDKVCAMVEGVKALGMGTCVTLGMLTGPQALRLKSAGLAYYNHNIDTSPEYY